MGIKVFHGTSRWKRFRAWQKTLPKDQAVSGIGCWLNEEGIAELYIEYGMSKGISGKETKEAWERHLQEQLTRR